MAEPQGSTSDTAEGRAGDRRDNDRRRRDRRRTDRRVPLPWWRRPIALVGYGVAGALLLVGAYNLSKPDAPGPSDKPLVSTPAEPIAESKPVTASGRAEAAYSTGDFERLIIEGEGAVGKLVNAELFCAAPSRMSVRVDVPVEAPIAPLVQDAHVSAAECRWGQLADERREEFVLIVPPQQAAAYAAAPVTTADFIQRRHLYAQVEWVGRSRALALRSAGVLRGVLPGPQR
jgi:hypothetical protein